MGTLWGTWGHHNAEVGTCGRGDMLGLGPGRRRALDGTFRLKVKLHYAYEVRNLVFCIRYCAVAESKKCSTDREYMP